MKSMLMLMLLTMPVAAHADALFDAPCRQWSLPSSLVKAIVRQESGLNPNALNISGRSVQAVTREQAIGLIHKAQGEGLSFDVGLMQINSQWFAQLGLDPIELLDPVKNLEASLLILSREVRRYGLSWKAVARYHSPDPERGRQYTWKIFYRMQEARHEKAAFARGKKKIHADQELCDPTGVWRNHGIQPKGRLTTFRVREVGLLGESDPKQGRSSSPSRASESKR